MLIENPFEVCPSYETDHFLITPVRIDDSIDLFEVYSDPVTIDHMNNDNCGGQWQCKSIDILKEGIRSWIQAYEEKKYIRWTIKLKTNQKVIGTLELAPAPSHHKFFDGECSTGLLRLDLKSEFENQSVFSELYRMTNTEMIEAFGIEKIITKGLAHHGERLIGLDNSRYKKLPNYEIIKYPNYYISYKW